MKNVKKLLLTTAFATLLGVGAFVGVNAAKDAPVEKAEATSYELPSAGGVLLFRKHDNTGNTAWNDANAKTAFYFWNDNEGENCWSDFAKDDYKYQSGDHYVDYFMYPSDTTKAWKYVKVVRLNSSCTTPNWNDKWNESNNYTLSSNVNCYGPKYTDNVGYDATETKVTISGAISSGASFYFDKNGYDLLQSNHLIGAYLFGNTHQEPVAKVQFNLVHGFHNGNGTVNNELYEIVIPNSGAYRWLIIYRSTSLGGSWTNQTDDLTPSGNANNVFKMNNWSVKMYGTMADDSWSVGSRAEMLGRYIIDLTDTVCADYDDVTDNGSALAPKISLAKTEFGHMNQSDKNSFKNAVANKDGANYLAKGAARYDYVVAKYSLDNFADRELSYSFGAALNAFDLSASSASTTTIVLVSIVAVIAGAGFIFFKKKRLSK